MLAVEVEFSHNKKFDPPSRTGMFAEMGLTEQEPAMKNITISVIKSGVTP